MAVLNSAEFDVVVNITTSFGYENIHLLLLTLAIMLFNLRCFFSGLQSPNASPNVTKESDIGHFAWVGRTTASLVIQPQQTKVLRLQACFFQHGTYNMNGINITVKPLADIYQNYTITVNGSTQLIIVHDS